jgi:hypothetical protein
LTSATALVDIDKMGHFVEREARGPIVRLDLYNGSMMTTAVSILAFVVASFALWVSAEKLRLDLYNKRFDIYLRTLKFCGALFRTGKEDGMFAALQADFMIASRESKFLFSPKSGVYDQLRKLHEASVTMMQDMSMELPLEMKLEHQEKRFAAVALWSGPGLETLENLMAPYLNFHDVFPPSALLGWMLGWMRRHKNAA